MDVFSKVNTCCGGGRAAVLVPVDSLGDPLDDVVHPGVDGLLGGQGAVDRDAVGGQRDHLLRKKQKLGKICFEKQTFLPTSNYCSNHLLLRECLNF